MKIRRISAIEPQQVADGVTWLDLCTKDDQMGFTAHEIRLEPKSSHTLDQGATFHRVYYCLEGTYEVVLLNLLTHEMNQKSVLAVPKGTLSEIRCKDSSKKVRLVVFLISPEQKVPGPEAKLVSLDDVTGTKQDVEWGRGKSRRYLTTSDGFGITVTNTCAYANRTSPLEYKNHVEFVYFYEGAVNYIWDDRKQQTGIRQQKVEDGDGLLIILDQHDSHIVQILDFPAEAVCCFYPALTGTEVHDFDSKNHSSF